MTKARKKRTETSKSFQTRDEGKVEVTMGSDSSSPSSTETIIEDDEQRIVGATQGQVEGDGMRESQGAEMPDKEALPSQKPSSKGPLTHQLMIIPSFRKLVISHLIKKLR